VRRSIFIINEQGRIHWKHVSLVGVTFQKVNTLTKQLQTL